MTATKKTNVASLQRKIERLEAQVATLRDMLYVTNKVYSDMLTSNADRDIRIQQAMRLLSGEDECQ